MSAVHVEGQAQAGGGPLANATVTLWAGSSSDPRQLAQTKSGAEGDFQLNSQESVGSDVILYLTAQGGAAAVSKSGGDNPAIAWLSVLGNTPPPKAVINEMTTVASVWTNAQFLNGTVLKGDPLGLGIAPATCRVSSICKPAAGAQPSRARSTAVETPTMANFATLADVLRLRHARGGRCVRQAVCGRDDPRGNAPKDTLAAAQSIARYPWYQPERLFDLLASSTGAHRQDDARRFRSCRT